MYCRLSVFVSFYRTLQIWCKNRHTAHNNYKGNEIADQEAKMGTTKPITSQLPIPKSEISNIIRANTAQLWKERWAKQLKSKTMEYLLPDIETKLPNQIMKLCGYDMSIAIQYLSGHNFLFLASSLRPATSWRPHLTALTSARPPRPRHRLQRPGGLSRLLQCLGGNRRLCRGLWHQTWRIQNPRRKAQIFGRQLFRLQSNTFPALIGTAMTDCAAKRLSRRQNQGQTTSVAAPRSHKTEDEEGHLGENGN